MNCTLLVFVLNILSLVIVTSGSTCDQPTSPHGSVIIHPTQREKYKNGQVILFGCKQGFYLDGMPIITCNGNKWTQTQFRCLGFCPELRNILNGKVSHVTPQVGKAAIGFRCDNNSFQLIGRPRLECIDGRWNGKLPYCHKLPSCVRLQSPANGTLHGSDNSHSAEAKFTCFTGFELFGASTLTCDKGVWSSRVPTCKAYCTKIRDLPNGHVFGTRFSHGQVVSFKCKHGYELGGDRSLRCTNGRWNSSVPQCKVMQCVKPSIPRNSRIIYPRTNQVRYTHGTTIYLACHEGHLLTGSPIMVCNYTTWLKREFSCIASCPILGPVRNGVITHVTRKGGGEVEIKCHANYTLFGSSRLSCINGEWSSGIPSCKARCRFSRKPRDGYVIKGPLVIGEMIKHGEKITYDCFASYTMEGSSTQECNNGRWTNDVPKCKASCVRPRSIRNGRVSGRDFGHGKTVSYRCNGNYALEGRSTLTCDDGRWNPNPPVCRASCKDPGSPANGKRQQQGLRHNSWVSFSCDKNYQLEGERRIQCNDGTWRDNLPKCVAVCPDPGHLTNGIRLGKNFKNGSTVTFKCNANHDLIGNDTIRCEDKVWSGDVPICKARCRFSGKPLKGYVIKGPRVIGEMIKHGEKITYDCFASYTMEGSSTQECDNGRWTNDVPKCKASCVRPRSIRNGQVSGKDFGHGKTVSYRCDGNYALEGRSTLTCDDGRWNPYPPVCRASCKDPGSPANGKRRQQGLRHNSWVSFSCDKNYQLEGERRIQCNDGTWRDNLPKCVGKCKFLGNPKNGYTQNGYYLKDQYFSHGSSIKYACDPSYTIDGSSTLHCNDGVWNGSFPSCKASCSDPGYIDRGNRSGRDFSHGKVVIYECTNQTYSLVGNPRLTCLDGKWDSARPSCKSLCNKPGILKNGRVIGRNYSDGSVIKYECNKGYEVRGSPFSTCRRGAWEGQFPECEICVQVGAIFWGSWALNMGANNYYRAKITRITPTRVDFALVYDRNKKRSYPRSDELLIIDKVPSMGDVSPNSPVIANQFSDRDKKWYRTGNVSRTLGDSLVYVRFDDGEEKGVPLERVRLVSRPLFCSGVK